MRCHTDRHGLQKLIWGYGEVESFIWGNETCPKKNICTLYSKTLEYVLCRWNYFLPLFCLQTLTSSRPEWDFHLNFTWRYTLPIRASIYLDIIVVAIHVDICRLVQLQGHSSLWPNLIIPIKTMFILSVITVIWLESSPLIVHSDTVFMLVSLWLYWLSG